MEWREFLKKKKQRVDLMIGLSDGIEEFEKWLSEYSMQCIEECEKEIKELETKTGNLVLDAQAIQFQNGGISQLIKFKRENDEFKERKP
jgi:hypothetical protein